MAETAPGQASLPFSHEEEVGMLRSTVRHLEDENARLKEIIARLTRREFGSASERSVNGTLDMEVEEPPAPGSPAPEAAGSEEEKPSAPRKRTRRLWADISRVVEHELVPDEVLADPDAYVLLEEKEVQTSQRLEFVPAHAVLHVYYRRAYVRRDGRGASLRAAAPASILPGSNMGASVFATLAHGKYCLHLPLYRQLREFTALNSEAKFETSPEYPEFAWVEGIVNAVAHREYAIMGDCIRVSMYDDRMEIESPGKLPHPVTLENMRRTRRSRNPLITRVLTEMKWVRELNEGVPRIYSDMEGAFLHEPEFSEGAASLKLVLRNNIRARRLRRENNVSQAIGADVWNALDDVERDILVYLAGHRDVKTRELASALKFSHSTVYRRLKRLSGIGVVKSRGISNSPMRTYNMEGLR